MQNKKYYAIARKVAKKTPITTEQVLTTISKVISVLSGFGYSKDIIESYITVEHISNVVMKNVAKGRY